MAHSKSFIPSAYAAYNLFFKNICQCVNEKTTGQSPAWTHIPADEVTALNAAYADWYNAYAPTLKPHTPGEAALVKPAYQRSHKVLSRFIQVWIRGFPDIITAKDLADLGIPPIDPTHTPVPQPTAQAEADVVLPGPHLVELWIKELAASLAVDPDRPNHGVRIFWGVLGSPNAQDKFRIAAPPASGSDLPHSTFTRRKKYRFDFPEEDRGKTVYFCLRYENEKGGKEGEGPFGPIFSAIIP